MDANELGRILGNAISELENAAITIDETIDMLMDVDGKLILEDGADEAEAEGKPYMTSSELGDLLSNALDGVENVSMAADNVRGLLESIESD